jgi:RND family efflux transporter MFP subunit
VVTVVQMERVRVVFDAAEQDMGKLQVGQTATIRVKSYDNRTFEGKVLKISPILDPMTRMATVEALVDNPEYLLKPGMFAEVEITTGVLDDVIVVPRYAVLESTTLKRIDGQDRVSKNYFVYVVDDSLRAEKRLLEPDYINHKTLAVSGGVNLGEKLVVSGQFNLREHMPVLIAEEEAN